MIGKNREDVESGRLVLVDKEEERERSLFNLECYPSVTEQWTAGTKNEKKCSKGVTRR